jgi:hypothetical protein
VAYAGSICVVVADVIGVLREPRRTAIPLAYTLVPVVGEFAPGV